MSALVASRLTPDQSSAMISVTEPGEISPIQPSGWGRYMHLAFADVSFTESTIRELGSEAFHQVYSDAITSAQAKQASKFVRDLANDPGIARLYIHCHRGRSRSAAIAIYASQQSGVALDTDTREHNRLVLTMLHHPDRYAHLFSAPNFNAPKRDTSIWGRLVSLVHKKTHDL